MLFKSIIKMSKMMLVYTTKHDIKTIDLELQINCVITANWESIENENKLFNKQSFES